MVLSDPTRATTDRREDRRARPFLTACYGILCLVPIFWGIGAMQGGWRANLVYAMSTAFGVAVVVAIGLVRTGRLSAAVHLMTAAGCAALCGGMAIGGRVGPGSVLFPGMLALGIFHVRPADILAGFALTTACVAGLGLTLPPMDPVQVPTLLTMQVLVGLLVWTSARVTSADIADLERTNSALDEARLAADAASHAKSVFLATMSHELRTPLNAVIGYAEMLGQQAREDDLDPAEATEDLGRIEAAGRQLLGMVSNVLDIARVESGQLVLHEQDVPAADLLADALAGASPRAGVELAGRSDLAPEATVRTDRSVVAQIAGQLVANACRFTQHGRVDVWIGGSPARLTVRDTGPGVAPADRERIFEQFTQADGSFTRRVDGAGLGLALCRRLADRLGATLHLEDTPGGGATFVLELPERG